MRVFGISTRGYEVLLGLLTIVGALSVYDFFLNDFRWNDPVLVFIGGSALGVVFCLYKIFGWSALCSYLSQIAARITGSRLIAILSIVLAVVNAYVILATAGAEALGGIGGVRQPRPQFPFSPSIVAIVLGSLALALGYKRGNLRATLWLAVPAIIISLAAIAFGISVLASFDANNR